MKSLCGMVAGGLLALLAGGCANLGPGQQRLVSKPSMQFSQTSAQNYDSKLMPQVQPGLATSGGAQASTCTLCR